MNPSNKKIRKERPFTRLNEESEFFMACLVVRVRDSPTKIMIQVYNPGMANRVHKECKTKTRLLRDYFQFLWLSIVCWKRYYLFLWGQLWINLNAVASSRCFKFDGVHNYCKVSVGRHEQVWVCGFEYPNQTTADDLPQFEPFLGEYLADRMWVPQWIVHFCRHPNS